jgi:AraC-like DNA-binding protein
MSKLDFLFFDERALNKYIPKHFHECYEIVYYFHGKGITQIGPDHYDFKTNTFALISPQVIHDDTHTVRGNVLYIGFHSKHPAVTGLNAIYNDDHNRTIEKLMLQMKDEFTQKHFGYSEMLDLLVDQLIIHLQRLIGAKRYIQSEDPLQYVLNYMDEHFRQKISIESLAKMSGYSYDRFRHLFKEKYGAAPLQYLFTRRFEYAKEQLLASKVPISNIAYSAGFATEAQFCKMFKRDTGTTARAFRHSIIKEANDFR